MYARYVDRPWVLYDLQKDPFQQRNLVGKPEAAATQARLEKRLAQWMKETGDAWSYNWTQPLEDGGRLYRHQTFDTVAEYLSWAKPHPELAPNG